MLSAFHVGQARRACEKADSTLRSSRAVPHPSTNRALRRLTSEVRRDPVHSTRYGRQRNYSKASNPQNKFSRCADIFGNDDKLFTGQVLYPENPHNNACQVQASHANAKKVKADAHVEKADSTLRSSRAVPHPSTNRALRRLTSEVRRDPVHSTRYGRQRNYSKALGTAAKLSRETAQQSVSAHPDMHVRRKLILLIAKG